MKKTYFTYEILLFVVASKCRLIFESIWKQTIDSEVSGFFWNYVISQLRQKRNYRKNFLPVQS